MLADPAVATRIFTYLAGRVGEDLAQEVVIHYLKAREPVSYPLKWAWRKAMWLKMNAGRDTGTRIKYEALATRLIGDRSTMTPLRVLLAKEILEEKRERLWKRYRDDYQVVLRLREVVTQQDN